jgi:hypothetical protein
MNSGSGRDLPRSFPLPRQGSRGHSSRETALSDLMEGVMNRRIILWSLLGGLALALSLARPGVAAEKVSDVNERSTFPLCVGNPCDQTGDPEACGEVSFHFVGKEWVDKHGNHHFRGHVNSHFQGVTADGQRYVGQHTEKIESDGCVSSNRFRFHLISQGSDDNFFVDILMTENLCTGEISVVQDEECRG